MIVYRSEAFHYSSKASRFWSQIKCSYQKWYCK